MTKKSFTHVGVLVLAGLASSVSAEVLIKGAVDQSYERLDTKTNPGALTGTDSLERYGSTLANYNWLSFSGNEDIRPGLKATFEFSLKYVGPDTQGRSPQNYLSHVGLEGEFGKLKVGQQWRPMFTAIAATDPTQVSATPGFAGAGKSGTGLSGLASEPNSDSITYNLPSFTPGLFIQLQHGFANTKQGENSGGHIIFTDGKKFFVTYALHNEKMLKGSYFAASLTGTNGVDKTVAGAVLMGLGGTGLPHVLYSSANGGNTRESSGLAGTYDFGFVKLAGGHVTEKVNGTSAKLNMDVVGAKIPIGQRMNLGYLHSIASHTRANGTEFTLSGDKLLLTYDLSKRTTVYYAYGKQQLDGGTTTGNEFSTSMDAIGLRHTF